MGIVLLWFSALDCSSILVEIPAFGCVFFVLFFFLFRFQLSACQWAAFFVWLGLTETSFCFTRVHCVSAWPVMAAISGVCVCASSFSTLASFIA